MSNKTKQAAIVWATFQEKEQITDEQLELFKRYASFLLETNKDMNLTAITELTGVVRQHFRDSLALRKFVDLGKLNLLVDIGSGAGFPGVPLKILYPELKVILIEVTKKRAHFLRDLIAILELEDIEVCEYDWRTFLRIVEADVDMFVTKAALAPAELARAFKPGCRYKQVPIVYWAAKSWEPDEVIAPFVQRVEKYKLGYRERKLVFLSKS